MGVIFISGIYGVGKTTLAKKIEETLFIPYYNASKLISNVNFEEYVGKKYVSNIKFNQEILLTEVNKLLKKQNTILLTGHFCYINKNMQIRTIPISVFKKMNIDKIVLLRRNIRDVYLSLLRRDTIKYSIKILKELQMKEEKNAVKVSKRFNIPLYSVDLNFDEKDLTRLINIINMKNNEEE